MKRVIRRTRGERKLRKQLNARLQSLAQELFTGLGDTERRIRQATYDAVHRRYRGNNPVTQWAYYRFCLTAAWLHPSGSAMMYEHYRQVSHERAVPNLLETWGSKLMLRSFRIAEELYGGSWVVNYWRKEEKSNDRW